MMGRKKPMMRKPMMRRGRSAMDPRTLQMLMAMAAQRRRR